MIKCRSGQGIIVVVEGETQYDDVYCYSSWFGDRAREITFICQNGCLKVQEAVKELREKIPNKLIFGIIGRDFTLPERIENQFISSPQDYIFYTRYYTLENYFFQEEVWQQVIYSLCYRDPPSGWQTKEEIRQ